MAGLIAEIAEVKSIAWLRRGSAQKEVGLGQWRREAGVVKHGKRAKAAKRGKGEEEMRECCAQPRGVLGCSNTGMVRS